MLKETPAGLYISVRVAPKAKCSAACGWNGEELKVKIAAPPEKDRANEELIRFLSDYFAIPRASILVVKGRHARSKTLFLKGCRAADLRL